MPSAETPRMRELSERIAADVVPLLEEANPYLPKIRELDAMLMVSVDPSLAAAHALASGYMIEMVQGAAECLVGLSTDLTASAVAWETSDEAAAADLS